MKTLNIIVALLVSQITFGAKPTDTGVTPDQYIRVNTLGGDEILRIPTDGQSVVSDVIGQIRRLCPELNEAEVDLVPTDAGKATFREYTNGDQIIPAGTYNVIPNLFGLFSNFISNAQEYLILSISENEVTLATQSRNDLILKGTAAKKFCERVLSITDQTLRLTHTNYSGGSAIYGDNAPNSLSSISEEFKILYKTIQAPYISISFTRTGGKFAFIEYHFNDDAPTPESVKAIMKFLEFLNNCSEANT